MLVALVAGEASFVPADDNSVIERVVSFNVECIVNSLDLSIARCIEISI